MWTYGSPDIYPASFIQDGVDSSGQVKYTYEQRTFRQRIFNENSLPFFILLIIFVLVYICENIIIGLIYKKVFKKYGTMDEKQPHFIDIKDKINDWTLASYNPSLNLKYSKIMMAMLDVAEVNSNFDIERMSEPIAKNNLNKDNDNASAINNNNRSDEGSHLAIIDKTEQDILPSIHQHREILNVSELENQINKDIDSKTVSELQNSNSNKRVFDEEEE